MEKIDDILLKLREFAENDHENTIISLKKINAIRLIDYIDKLEDEEILLKALIAKNIQVEIINKGEK